MVSGRAVRWAPWVILGLFVLTGTVAQTLWYLNDQALSPDDPTGTAENIWLFGVFTIYSIIGALAASRRPDSAIGWLFLAVACIMALGFFSEQYAVYALATNPGSLPFGQLVGWPTLWTWIAGLGLLVTFSLLLFPNGRLPSPRWRVVAWLSAITITFLVLLSAFVPSHHEDFPNIRNPFGLDALAGLSDLPNQLVGLLPLCGVLSAASLIARYRHGTPTERQQIKWFSFAALLLALVLFFEFIFGPYLAQAGLSSVPAWLFDLAIAAIPVTTGIAIFRYRLWDIDVIISRTLLYTGLSVILALVYFASVLLLQAFFQLLTGQSQSQLVTVLSTLGIAVLFSPLRRRLQAALDQRFYRRQYDATRILSGFSTAARNEVDLDRLTDDLVAVVADAMQPAHLSLWQGQPLRTAPVTEQLPVRQQNLQN